MAITPSDFSKIWASNADTPEYTFSEADYLKGWDFVGNLPPTRAMWNAMQKSTDEKMKYVFDNFGAPLLANTVAEMTMQNRVYVYTGNETGYTAGHWYYWDGTAWTDGGVYNAVVVQTDTTLTQAGVPADAKATGDKFTEKDARFTACFDEEHHESLNLLNPNNINSGYYWTDGYHSSSSYVNTGLIPLESGKTYTMQIGSSSIAINRQVTSARFGVYIASDGTTVVDSGSYVSTITLPAGAKYVVLSYNSASVDAFKNVKPSFVEGTTVVDYIPYFEPYESYTLKDVANSPQTLQNAIDIENLKEQIAEEGYKDAIFTATADTLSANTNLICCNSCDNKKNEYIELTANFTSFGELTIAHGKGSYMGMYITITSSKINIYNASNTLIEEYEHSLTLSDFINVIIYTKNDNSCRSRISIMSAGGDYSIETSRYYSCRAAVLCNADFSMTNVKMRYTVNDAKEDVWVFGDSYISLGDPNRWATQMIMNNHKNVLFCGFGGATSANVIVSFRELIAVARPKYIVWALGMNDGDTSSAVNTNWKTCVDEVIATCEANGITPILATIPNVPNVRNTFKNDYVKSTGLRYVDFAKAVNAENAGATWYAGMLSSDNTHPTALGAKALMRRFLLDVPEVLYAEE